MYTIKLSSEHYIGAYRPVRLGLPIPAHTVPDICICSNANSEPILLNSFILREALLTSTTLLEKLGLKVVDLTKEPKQVEQQPKIKEEPIQENKEQNIKRNSKSKKGVEDTWE